MDTLGGRNCSAASTHQWLRALLFLRAMWSALLLLHYTSDTLSSKSRATRSITLAMASYTNTSGSQCVTWCQRMDRQNVEPPSLCSGIILHQHCTLAARTIRALVVVLTTVLSACCAPSSVSINYITRLPLCGVSRMPRAESRL